MPVNVNYLPPDQEPANYIPAQPDPGLWGISAAQFELSSMTAPVESTLRSLEIFNLNRKESSRLPVEELNSTYGIEGRLEFTESMTPAAAERMRETAVEQAHLEMIAALGDRTAGRTAMGFVAALSGQIADPLNIALSFVGVGQARTAALALKMGGSMTAAKATIGLVEGAVGAAVLEPIVLANMNYQGLDYDLEDSLASIGYSAIGGSVLMAGGHLLSQHLGKIRQAEAVQLDQALNELDPAIRTEMHNGYMIDTLEDRGSISAGRIGESLSDIEPIAAKEVNIATGTQTSPEMSTIRRQAMESFENNVRTVESQKAEKAKPLTMPEAERLWTPERSEELVPAIDEDTALRIETLKATAKSRNVLQKALKKELSLRRESATKGVSAKNAEGQKKAIDTLEKASKGEAVEMSDDDIRTAVRELIAKPGRTDKLRAADVDNMTMAELDDLVKEHADELGLNDELGFSTETRQEYDSMLEEAKTVEAEADVYRTLAGCVGGKV